MGVTPIDWPAWARRRGLLTTIWRALSRTTTTGRVRAGGDACSSRRARICGRGTTAGGAGAGILPRTPGSRALQEAASMFLPDPSPHAWPLSRKCRGLQTAEVRATYLARGTCATMALMQVIEAQFESGVLRPSRPLTLRPGERVRLIVVRQPDTKRWDMARVARSYSSEESILTEHGSR